MTVNNMIHPDCTKIVVSKSIIKPVNAKQGKAIFIKIVVNAFLLCSLNKFAFLNTKPRTIKAMVVSIADKKSLFVIALIASSIKSSPRLYLITKT